MLSVRVGVSDLRDTVQDLAYMVAYMVESKAWRWTPFWLSDAVEGLSFQGVGHCSELLELWAEI